MSKAPIAVLGIDLGKNSSSVVGLDASGAVVYRRCMTRDSIVAFTANLPACIVALEACCGAHCLGRMLAAQGHTIRLMSPEYVQPYVKAQKTDNRDAEAIAEAATRPTMRFVSLKSEAQLDLQVVHRMRERLVLARTTLINQFRAVLLERGVIMPKGRRQLMRRLDNLEKDDLAVSPRIARLLRICERNGRYWIASLKLMTQNSLTLTRSNEQARRLGDHSRRRCHQCHCPVGGRGGRQRLRQGSRPRRLAGVNPPAALNRRQNQNARDQQTGKPLFAQAADPRSARRHAPPGRQANENGSVVKGSAGTIAPQCRRRGASYVANHDNIVTNDSALDSIVSTVSPPSSSARGSSRTAPRRRSRTTSSRVWARARW